MKPSCFLKLVLLVVWVRIGCSSVVGQNYPCSGGMAGPYPCDGVDQLSSVALTTMAATGANDVWGWYDALTGKEYALLGLNNGLAFIDVSNPLYPVYLGKLPTASSSSLWRDMKVYGDYVYVVSEAFAHGLQVFDLTTLREVESTPETFLPDAVVSVFSDAHNLAVDEVAGRLYVVGSNLAGGGLLIFDLSNPLSPTLVGMHESSGYVHDVVAKSYSGPDPDHAGSVLVACAHPTNWSILDVTDPSDVQSIATGQHPSNGYTHQPLWTPSGKHLLVGDELDEQQYGFNTRTLWWDVTDLDDPTYGGAYFGSTASSDHNQYATEHFIFQSNYTAGLRILKYDETAGFALNELAFFDVHPASNSVGFTGSWSNYAHLPSGNVLVSSMQYGLHVLRPKWMTATFSAAEVCQTESALLSINVPKDLGVAFTLSLEGLPANAIAEGLPYTTYGTGTWEFEVSGLAANFGALGLNVVMSSGDWVWKEPITLVVDGGEVWFVDADGDGYGDPAQSVILCSSMPGYVANGLDCYDQSAFIFPGAPEQCDALDNDCNGWIDDGLMQTIWYRDVDGDGYGNAAVVAENCYCPAGFVEFNGDCNDYNPFVHPFAPGNGTGLDNNCDGVLSESEQNPCPGDFNLDHSVTVADLLVMLFDYACVSNCDADLNGDGLVGMSDMLFFLSVFNTTCN